MFVISSYNGENFPKILVFIFKIVIGFFVGSNPGQTGPIVVYIIRIISRSCDMLFIHMCFVHYLFKTGCNTCYWQIRSF